MIFSLPAGNSRRRRRLKRIGATAPVLTGVWGRQPPTSTRRYIPGHCLPLLPLPTFVTGMKISILNEAGAIQDDISVFAHKSAKVNCAR